MTSASGASALCVKPGSSVVSDGLRKEDCMSAMRSCFPEDHVLLDLLERLVHVHIFLSQLTELSRKIQVQGQCD